MAKEAVTDADSTDQTVRDELLELWRVNLEAMDAGDTETLRSCFTPDASLVHMTGYVQPLDEWMAGIRRREFVYHRIAERSVTVTELTPTRATVVGRIVTGITDDGSGQAWPLRVENIVQRIDGEWLFTQSKVTFDA